MTLKRLFMIGLAIVCLAALPVMAQEGESAVQATSQASGGSGITTLVILSGLGAVVLVGAWIYRRENAPDGKEVD